MSRRLDSPLPRDWPKHTRSGLIHAIALAHLALVRIRSWCANSRIARVRLAAESERLHAEVAMLREELRIKDARLARIPPRKRPQYPPAERLSILALRAARGWNAAQTARRFLLTAATIASWMRRLDEGGPDALVQIVEPVNRYPDFVRALVAKLRATLPHMGKVRLAQMLARAGLSLAPTTIARLAAKQPRSVSPPPRRQPAVSLPVDRAPRRVTARGPHDVWHVDLTVMPTSAGFWIPRLPLSFLQCWPFAWWIGVVLDHASRSVIAERVFHMEPTAEQVCALLDAARQHAGRAPRYIISDRGCQFQDAYRNWCWRWGVRPRFGAVGKHGSIAIVERFILSMKTEALRRILVPLPLPLMRAEVAAYVRWYNTCRPHTTLGGATPQEVLDGVLPAGKRPRLEPRARYPLARRDPATPLRRRVRERLELVVERVEGRAHLPVIELRRAA